MTRGAGGGDGFVARLPFDLRGGLCARMPDWEEMTDGTAQPDKSPDAKTQERWDEAKEVCQWCPSLEACHAQRMQHRLGVWGGTDQYQRYLEHKRNLKAALKERKQREASATPAEAGKAATGPMEPTPLKARQKPGFPAGDPEHCDAWVRDHRGISPAWVEAVTPDGSFYRVKIKATYSAQTIKWLPVEDVDRRRPGTPVVVEWINRPKPLKAAG